MLQGVNPNCFYAIPEHQVPVTILTVKPHDVNPDDKYFRSDEFRMYGYKIRRCPRTRSHDWTECPYAHRGEKAQRRDPRRVRYSPVACSAFRNGNCIRGDSCEFAHGVFEYWLHPARYRTRPCTSGVFCRRKVCFFAHTTEELRREIKHKHFSLQKPKNNYRVRSSPNEVAPSIIVPNVGRAIGPRNVISHVGGDNTINNTNNNDNNNGSNEFHDFLKSLSGLTINDNFEELDMDHVDWVSRLLD